MAVSDAEAVNALLERQLHFVSGKGGVGKSVVAVALAHRFVEAGHDTLLCQVNARDSHRSLLSRTGERAPAIDDEVHQIEPHLWAVNMTPRAALHEYARMVLRFDSVVRAVFDNRLARAFLRFVPALAELNMLGKIWFHATEADGERRRFGRIVVDAPSTGHGLSFLGVAKVLHDLTRGRGPMAEKTAQMQELLTDPERTALHIVTLPEELPTNEALEMIQKARVRGTAPLGMLLVNMVTPPLFDDDDARVLARASAPADDDEAAAALEVAERRLAREQLEAEHLARSTPERTAVPRVLIPLSPEARFGRAEIATVGEALT